MNCKNCGKEVNQEWSTCPYCGCMLKEDNAKSENSNQVTEKKPKKKGKLKKILIFLVIVFVGLMILGSLEDDEEGGNVNTEVDSSDDTTEESNEQDVELSYDFDTDVQCGLLYADSKGKIVDVNGKEIEEYDWVQVVEGQIVWNNEDVMDMYAVDENGQIIYYVAEVKTPLERLKAKASQAGCTTEIIVDEQWLGTDYEDLAYDVADDGDYFDEVVLGAWFDEYGVPIARGGLPEKLSQAIALYVLDHQNSKASGLLEHFRFVDGDKLTMDTLKRTSPNELATYALVLTNIMKGTDANGNEFFQGWDYISSTPVIISGEFHGILNGDNLLVFAEFTGLASDDTPNFKGIYIENINDRDITSLE